MTTIYIRHGSRLVIVTRIGPSYTARLYVNHGETATLQTWKGKTMAGARNWANKVMVDGFQGR